MSTDLDVWHQTASGQVPRWEERANVISHFIRPKDVVVDLGAGDQKLRRLIPATCKYIPVDCVNVIPETFVVDYNKEFKFPNVNPNIIISAGFLEYITDLKNFMTKLAAHNEGVVFLFTYSYAKNKRHNRKQFIKLNAMRTAQEVMDFFAPYSRELREVLRFKNQSLFTCVLSLDPIASTAAPMIINEALPRLSFWKRTIGCLHVGR